MLEQFEIIIGKYVPNFLPSMSIPIPSTPSNIHSSVFEEASNYVSDFGHLGLHKALTECTPHMASQISITRVTIYHHTRHHLLVCNIFLIIWTIRRKNLWKPYSEHWICRLIKVTGGRSWSSAKELEMMSRRFEGGQQKVWSLWKAVKDIQDVKIKTNSLM